MFRLTVIIATLMGCVGMAEAQQQAKVPKIGWLGTGPGTSSGSGPSKLFWREFSKLGYVEGKNITIEYRYADNKLDLLPALAEELVRLKVELLVTGGVNGALAAKNATKTIAIVFNNVDDPIAAGLVDSLARPAGNITGFTIISGVLAGKRLELLKEAVPKLARVAVLWDPLNSGSTQQWQDTQLAARELGLQLHSMVVSSADKFESAFKDAVQARSAGLTVTSEPVGSLLTKTGHGPGDKKSAAGDILSGRFCRRRWLDVLRSRPGRTLQARRYSCRQDPEGNQARRHSRRTTDQVRADHQPQDRQADWPDDTAECDGKSGQSDSVRQGQRDIWIIYPGLGDHVSLASSVATSCKTSHSSGVSTVILEVSKSFLFRVMR